MPRLVAQLVLANRPLLRVVVAFFCFTLGDWARWLAILVYAFERGGATEAGLVSLLQLVPAAVVAPLAANIGDRFSRERMLQLAYGSQAVALAATATALLADAPVGIVYGLAVLAVMATSLARPAHASLLPGLVRDPAELTAANVASGWVEGLGVLAGPAVAGAMLAVTGPGMVFLLTAALMAVGAALSIALPVLPVGGRRVRGDVGAEIREALAGFSALARLPGPRAVVLVLGASSLLWGAVDVLNVALAVDVMGTGPAGAGALGAALGVGGLVGAAASASLVGRPRLTNALLVGLLVWGLPIAAIAILPVPIAAAVLLVAAGAGRSLMDVAGRTLLQRSAPDEVLSRVFGILEATFLGAFGLGSILVAVVITAGGPRLALAVAGLWLPVVAVLGWRGLRSLDRVSVVAIARLALLRRIPMFAPLSAPVIERLARQLVELRVPAGATVIRQGDAGDRFYVIEEGLVDFAIDGRAIRVGEPGEGFGEIALLRDVPRTATATARTDVRLLALDREDFLSAVTGYTPSRRVAEAVVAARLET